MSSYQNPSTTTTIRTSVENLTRSNVGDTVSFTHKKRERFSFETTSTDVEGTLSGVRTVGSLDVRIVEVDGVEYSLNSRTAVTLTPITSDAERRYPRPRYQRRRWALRSEDRPLILGAVIPLFASDVDDDDIGQYLSFTLDSEVISGEVSHIDRTPMGVSITVGEATFVLPNNKPVSLTILKQTARTA